MAQASCITVTYSRESLGLLWRAFSLILVHFENPKIVDPIALMVSKPELEGIVSMIEASLGQKADPCSLTMDLPTWGDFGMALWQADSSVPGLSRADLEALEALEEDYHRRDDEIG